jgi:crotonobetainyl-CoA hydratase
MNGMADGISWATQGHILVVTIDRPARRNALDPAAHHQLASLFDAFATNDALHVAIITGAGDKAFCAGSDLTNARGLRRSSLPVTGFAGLAERFDLIKPVIAAVNGDAIGGGLEVVLACDLCVARAGARFALPEPRVGLAASGGLHRLARHLPRKWVMELALTAQMFDAEDARRLGIVNRITAPGQALAMAIELAQIISQNAPLAVQATKQMIDQGLTEADLRVAFAGTYPAFDRMQDSEDAREGRAAFLEKRPPKWQGR